MKESIASSVPMTIQFNFTALLLSYILEVTVNTAK